MQAPQPRTNAARFRAFVTALDDLVGAGSDEPRILNEGAKLLHELVLHDDWLPDEFARPEAGTYRQYLLYCDPRERYSIASFVWAPGAGTPVHDHTVWGLVGVMRGAELCREYPPPQAGRPMAAQNEHRVGPGSVDRVSPAIGDIHTVSNALADEVSISIHVYGANIGAVSRHVYDEKTGAVKPFVSGYHNSVLPNFWDRSAEVRKAAGL
jgi:predicted metal-dependent enzyme (double-stranded beta helix superfamily)